MFQKLVVAVVVCASFSWAAKFTVFQQGEVVSAPRPSAVPSRLLFAFVTDLAGFDTEITLSNTSQDTSGSPAQPGSCTLSYYGANAPAPRVSFVIPAGKQIIFRLSSGGGGIGPAPNFQGYIMANCTFPLARGIAKIFASNGSGLAYSQDAQVIAAPRSTATPQYLLFPFITNRGGYDTGFGIANTSADPFGTTAISGSCTLSFYGTNAPAPVATGNIAAGTVNVYLASSIAPNFQGYMIAACGFPGAAGTGFMSDLAERSLLVPANPELLTTPRDATPRPLLFPLVTNQNGLDTSMLIANTSQDPVGSAPTAGSCTLNYYGTNAPASTLIGNIQPGTVFPVYASINAPNFQGYVIAVCTFPHARGWALTLPVGGTTEGDAQTAEVFSTPRSAAQTPLLFTGANNSTGADTQITIDNTTSDPFGTAPITGACTISYFGDPAAAPQVSSAIPPGGRLSFSLSQGNPGQGIAATPGFHGSVIADCGFPLARGLASITGTGGGSPTSVQPDFNRDGHVDVIWQDPASGQAQAWFLGGAQGTSVVGAAGLAGANSWKIAGVGDFNLDGYPDLVWQDPASGIAQVWFLGGAQGNVVTGAANISGPNSWRIVSVADFNGDGVPDLVWQDISNTGQAQIWFMGGAQGTTITGAAPLAAANTWRIVGAGDFNGDGSSDVIWQDPASGVSQIWYLGGAQGNVVVNAANLSGANSWRIAGAGDYNGDGRPDVIWQDPATGTSQVWFLGGSLGTTITGAAPLSGANSWRIVGPR